MLVGSFRGSDLLLASSATEVVAAAHLARRRKSGIWLPMAERRKQFQERYRHDAAAFARDCIRWDLVPAQSALAEPIIGLAPYQEDVLQLLSENERVAVRATRGAGKSTTAAIAVIWWAEVNDGWRDWKVVTSASVWKQLTDYLWPEIHKIARYLNWYKMGREPYVIGKELLQEALKLSTGSVTAVNASLAQAEEGAHASAIMYLYDEAKLIPDEKWDSAEGALSTGEVKFLAISTPSFQAGRFWHIFQRRPGTERWVTRHIQLQETLDAGRVSKTWVEERKAQWGEDSSLYRMQVLGEFGQMEANGMVPLAWLERAHTNWLAWQEAGFPGRITQIAVDVGGGSGGDMSVIAVVYDNVKVRMLRYSAWAIDKASATMELVGKLAPYGRQGIPLHVDAIGVGLGVYHRAHELNWPVYPFVSSWGTGLLDSTRTVGFKNWRAAGWGILRDLLSPDSHIDVCIPPDDSRGFASDDETGFIPNSTATADITIMKRSLSSTGNWQVSSKDDIKKELGSSPDLGDAIMMAMAGPILWMQRQTEEAEGRVIYAPVPLG